MPTTYATVDLAAAFAVGLLIGISFGMWLGGIVL